MARSTRGLGNARTMKAPRGLSSLTLQFISYSEIANLDTVERIRKLLKMILANKLVLLQGRLKAEEEARLIEDTMALVGSVKGFKGIELAVLSPRISETIFDSMKRGLAKMLVGESDSITIIGPASIVREAKKDPNKIQFLLNRK